MLGLGLKVGVCDAQTMKCAELEEPLSVLIHLPYPMVTEAGGPEVMVCANSGVEVTEKGELLRVGDIPNSRCEALIELVLRFWRSC